MYICTICPRFSPVVTLIGTAQVALAIAIMSEKGPSSNPVPADGHRMPVNVDPSNDAEAVLEKTSASAAHVESAASSESGNEHRKAAVAAIRQQHTIPTTGKRIPTGKWEYILYCVFYFSLNGARR